MPTYFQRPENALKRANEFIDVGKKQRALDALYDVIKSKRHRTWQKIHEPIMTKYLELCIDLRKSHVAKEGLFQYRNICQQVNIKSLEDVVRFYIQLAEEKTELARATSQHATVDIDDLDNLQTPESLLLSAVSGEVVQDRTDRVVLTPWVKFLWESYRQCLELLRNNSRVERLYHDIAQEAFNFCLKYTRKTEFRKLCDNLRTHLGHIHKHQNQQTAVNLNNPESQAMNLETRLCQLERAIQMELWQEAYKAVEDIHGLMTMPKKAPRAQLLATYYKKLSLVFWKAGNYMFHASALFRLFTLCREQRKSLTQEEMQKMASRVLMAMLAIPIPPPRNEIDRSLEADETALEKQRRLATLLALPNSPTRQSLLRDLVCTLASFVRFNVVPHVPQQFQELYQWLEVEFHPLKLCTRVQTSFDAIAKLDESGELKQYVPAIQDNCLIRLLKQVAQVYHTMEYSRLLKLAPFATTYSLERIIVDMARYSDLQVRIDHRSGTLQFGTGLNVSQREDAPEGPQLQIMRSEQIRTQLIQLSTALHRTVALVRSGQKEAERDQLRQTIVAAYRQNAKADHARILSRRQIIEERKEMLENLNIQREEEERRQAEEQRRKQIQLEEERLAREAEERERQRQIQEMLERNRRQVKDKIEQLKKQGLAAKIFMDINEEDLEKLDADEIMQRQTEQMDKERRELQNKLKQQEKLIDHMARAMRIEEAPLMRKAFAEKKVKDREFWNQQEKERIATMVAEREVALQHRDRLKRMNADKNYFMDQLMSARMSIYKEHVDEFEQKLAEERRVRLEERREQRKIQRREDWHRQKAEAAVKKKQEEERAATAARKAAQEAEYREHLAKVEAQAAKQRAREQELEEKRHQEEQEEQERKKTAEQRARPAAVADVWRRGEDSSGGVAAANPWRSKGSSAAAAAAAPATTGDDWRGRSRDDGGGRRVPPPTQPSRDEASWRRSAGNERSWRGGGAADPDTDGPPRRFEGGRDSDYGGRPRRFEEPRRGGSPNRFDDDRSWRQEGAWDRTRGGGAPRREEDGGGSWRSKGMGRDDGPRNDDRGGPWTGGPRARQQEPERGGRLDRDM